MFNVFRILNFKVVNIRAQTEALSVDEDALVRLLPLSFSVSSLVVKFPAEGL